ncbi:hypothetical protein E4U42_007371 [Claviceps africana]|uniref:Kynurenine formamidase n=1 Tax=Claviceps africana TaxID=83212 RepID=A0A8K0J6Y0_9HYPO|nr:hypothetical protein E4U42_007371 [Claviceps africana]
MGSIPDSWSEKPWVQRNDLGVPMWQKSQVAYASLPNQLQHVDVWVPIKYIPWPETETLPSSWLPDPHTLWVIYIHGGAWRDPLITSASFTPTLKNLSPAWLQSRKSPVAFASIDYSLSPYPSHPTDPSRPCDDSRNAAHPKHIVDVVEAISFLQKRADFGNNYILVGHSCGATLAFQAAMNPERWAAGTVKDPIHAPWMVLGINGLYDMLELTENPGGQHDQYRPTYAQITRNAFGHDKDVWRAISPAFVDDWATEWPDGRHVMLVQGPQDELVPYRQGERMKDSLVGSKADRLVVELTDGDGEHDDIWRKGTLLAKLLTRAVDTVSNL